MKKLLANCFRQTLLSRYFPWGMALLFTLPLLLWAHLDQGHWKGDPVGYAYKVICHYQDLTSNFGYWVLSQFVGYKGPLIFWVGQFLVPIGKLIGNINFALLLLPIFASLLSLVLMFEILNRIFQDRVVALLGSLLMTGSPLFFGLATGFWIEPLQVTVVLAMLHTVMQAERNSFWKSVSIFIIICCLSMLIKVATPMYIIGPAIWYILLLIKKPVRSINNKEDYILLAAAGVILLPTLVFYTYNLSDLLEFAMFAASSPVFIGSNTQLILLLWGLANGLTLKFVFLWSFILIITSVINCLFKSRTLSLHPVVGISVFQLALFIFSWLSASNGDTRYFLPILPYFIIFICWCILQINKRWVVSFSFLLAALQYFIVMGYSYGAVSLMPSYGMIRPLVRDVTPEAQLVTFICQLPSMNSKVVIDLEPEISLAEVLFELSKKDTDIKWGSYAKEVSNFFEFHQQQIDTSKIEIDKAFEKFLDFDPHYYITWKSRLDTNTIVSEMNRIDKYNAQTIPHRWEIASRISRSSIFVQYHMPGRDDVVIFKRLENITKDILED